MHMYTSAVLKIISYIISQSYNIYNRTHTLHTQDDKFCFGSSHLYQTRYKKDWFNMKMLKIYLCIYFYLYLLERRFWRKKSICGTTIDILGTKIRIIISGNCHWPGAARRSGQDWRIRMIFDSFLNVRRRKITLCWLWTSFPLYFCHIFRSIKNLIYIYSIYLWIHSFQNNKNEETKVNYKL
jgi:hypothetical protein